MDMNLNDRHIQYMRRALQLARHGFGDTNPNPMVGSVIVSPDGRIIGEGWHRRCGEGHAEVNAIASVCDRDRHLLRQSTMYVTLEPCSHYGRTPPCAKLIIDTGIPHVVVGAVDPFDKVSGRGIAMLADAGVRVEHGVLALECRRLNAMFMTANGPAHRPFVTLKWAQSRDGFLDCAGSGNYHFSNTLTRMSMHRLRTAHQAVLAGSGTYLKDSPRMSARYWDGPQPRPVALDRRRRLDPTTLPVGTLVISDADDVADVLRRLYETGLQSVLIEGGACVLHSFIQSGLWDAMRVETAPVAFGNTGVAPAPAVCATPISAAGYDGNEIVWYSNNELFTVSHPLCM